VRARHVMLQDDLHGASVRTELKMMSVRTELRMNRCNKKQANNRPEKSITESDESDVRHTHLPS
jgi:hypothetical protein